MKLANFVEIVFYDALFATVTGTNPCGFLGGWFEWKKVCSWKVEYWI